jgi:hypothetical protein
MAEAEKPGRNPGGYFVSALIIVLAMNADSSQDFGVRLASPKSQLTMGVSKTVYGIQVFTYLKVWIRFPSGPCPELIAPLL